MHASASRQPSPVLSCTRLRHEPSISELILGRQAWGKKMCFYSCHACKTAVTRGCAGSMGFSFGLKGEISVQSGDLLRGIPCRALAANPAANGAAAARRLLRPRVQSGKLALNEQRKTCLATIWPFASLYHAPHNNSSSCNQPPSVRT